MIDLSPAGGAKARQRYQWGCQYLGALMSGNSKYDRGLFMPRVSCLTMSDLTSSPQPRSVTCNLGEPR